LAQQRLWLTDVVLREEGPAQERRVRAQVLQPVAEEQLWIAERTFGTLGLRFGMARRGVAFVVRQPGQGPGELRGCPTHQGASRRGLV
jgi:hypothetical protein